MDAYLQERPGQSLPLSQQAEITLLAFELDRSDSALWTGLLRASSENQQVGEHKVTAARTKTRRRAPSRCTLWPWLWHCVRSAHRLCAVARVMTVPVLANSAFDRTPVVAEPRGAANRIPTSTTAPSVDGRTAVLPLLGMT